MAKKKFTPKVKSVAPDKFSPFVRRHFDRSKRFSNEKLSHIANTGYRKQRFRASFRARAGRLPGLTDKFFRLFSMFLVCLVLFASVTNAEYSMYQEAVDGLYTFTESVSDIAQTTLRSIRAASDWVGNIKDMHELEDGEKCVLSVKIKGNFYRFVCTAKNMKISDYAHLKIEMALDGYEKWQGKKFEPFMGWLKCPDWGIRVYSCYEYEGE